ncbi:hypothetical protein BB558_000843 [Smittium angustum]|uniref:Velvet domain-containing protein n=1 Tax=Smittium angustum TaxID=133377 RepID=A0A2U1JD45_SMIAN|nr:hypothetical protein BB558_000843 [Smittium angustum]
MFSYPLAYSIHFLSYDRFSSPDTPLSPVLCELSVFDSDANPIHPQDIDTSTLVANICVLAHSPTSPYTSYQDIVSGSFAASPQFHRGRLLFSFSDLVFNVSGTFQLKVCVFNLADILDNHQTSTHHLCDAATDLIEIT